MRNSESKVDCYLKTRRHTVSTTDLLDFFGCLRSRLGITRISTNNLLVIAPCPIRGLPSQGYAIAERLRQSGVCIRLLSRANSSWGRFLDIVFRGFLLTPLHQRVLTNVYGCRGFLYETATILYARLWRRRSVALLHNGEMPTFVARWPRWTRFVLSQPDLVLTPHNYLRDALSALGIRIHGTIPNFIDIEKYPFRERSLLTPRFLYLRGMHAYYNPEMALKAFAIVQQKYPDSILTMAGAEGNHSAHCRALARHLGLRNVNFVGQVSKEEIPVLAEKHDIHLHTNRIDNMPVSIIEMWACGLPIVATHVGGLPYLIRHRLDGILVPSEDAEAMAQGCLELLTQADLARALSRNGRIRAREFCWDRIQSAWNQALLLDGEQEKDLPV